MGCNCGKSQPQTYSPQQAIQSQSGANRALIKQIQDQQRQQAEIQRIVSQSANPSKVLIKTYY